MGRTVLSFTQELYREEESWTLFRRALRREDRELFDALFAAARYHTAACACSGRAVPFEAILMSILVEERRASRDLALRFEELARRAEALARRIAALEGRGDGAGRGHAGEETPRRGEGEGGCPGGS